jgi:molybdopterin converting factor subunit 1
MPNAASGRCCLPSGGARGYIFDMTVTVLLFASYADSLGARSLAMDLAPGTTVSDVLGRVLALPGAERLPRQPLVAVNERYAKANRVLENGDEVALIPPVAGG